MTLESPLHSDQNGTSVAELEHTRGGPTYRPNVDIYELPDELVVLTDMPGAKSDSIDIQFEDGELTIHGRTPLRQESEQEYLDREYGVGNFFRTFRVSEQIDVTRISAEYTAGVLKLRLPKTEAVKPRKIQVTSK